MISHCTKLGSRWVHSICRECWDKSENGREPTIVKDRENEFCCFCGQSTDAGIYIRADPKAIHPTKKELKGSPIPPPRGIKA